MIQFCFTDCIGKNSSRDTMLKLTKTFFIVLSAIFITADGHFYAMQRECISSSDDGRDIVLMDTYIFDQIVYSQFNSTVGKYVGYTEYGVRNAEYWNNNTAYMESVRADLDAFCRHNFKLFTEEVFDKAVEPKIKMTLVKEAEGSHPAVLMCSAYNFYPPNIIVTWLKNGKEFKGGVTSTEEMPDGDWYYQVHSHLEYTPQSGEEISCVVHHASSTKPYIYKWENSGSEADKSKIAIGASGLVLGIILSAAGFIYYKKKSHGRILVPT